MRKSVLASEWTKGNEGKKRMKKKKLRKYLFLLFENKLTVKFLKLLIFNLNLAKNTKIILKKLTNIFKYFPI